MKKALQILIVFIVLVSCKNREAQNNYNQTNNKKKVFEKPLVIPDSVSAIPPGNDFDNDTSKYNYKRVKQSPNFAIMWEKEIGDDPSKTLDSLQTFHADSILTESERFYDYYVNEAKFLEKGRSHIDSSKVLIIVRNSENKTAYGWGKDNVGIFWTPPERIHPIPYGVVAHELAHSFQYLLQQDGHWGYATKPEGSKAKPIFEMTAQYLLWQVYPEWMTFENYHLKSFLKKTHYAFLHETNQYHSPYVFEYWSQLHGKEFMGKLWREARKGEGPVMTYKRLNDLGQKEFNDELFKGYQKFMTWDLDRIREVAAPYKNMHRTKMIPAENGWYRISPENTPQNYGYNGIALELPSEINQIQMDFKGIAGAKNYRSIKTEKAGWRYGFVALTENGEREYSEVFSDPDAQVRFEVPQNTVNLWLVVMGAPTEHWEHITDANDATDEQWPYKIKLTGTALK